MAQICGEMTYLFDKLLKNVENDLEIWDMVKNLGNGFDAWGTAEVFEKRFNYLGNGLKIWQVAKICGKWCIYLGIGLSVWETAKIFGKWRRSAGKCLKYVGKWLNCLTNFLKMWKMT